MDSNAYLIIFNSSSSQVVWFWVARWYHSLVFLTSMLSGLSDLHWATCLCIHTQVLNLLLLECSQHAPTERSLTLVAQHALSHVTTTWTHLSVAHSNVSKVASVLLEWWRWETLVCLETNVQVCVDQWIYLVLHIQLHSLILQSLPEQHSASWLSTLLNNNQCALCCRTSMHQWEDLAYTLKCDNHLNP